MISDQSPIEFFDSLAVHLGHQYFSVNPGNSLKQITWESAEEEVESLHVFFIDVEYHCDPLRFSVVVSNTSYFHPHLGK